MKRGVRHYKLDGTALTSLNNVVKALIFEGEIFFDDACARRLPVTDRRATIVRARVR
jgi:hypothetical protein